MTLPNFHVYNRLSITDDSDVLCVCVQLCFVYNVLCYQAYLIWVMILEGILAIGHVYGLGYGIFMPYVGQ